MYDYWNNMVECNIHSIDYLGMVSTVTINIVLIYAVQFLVYHAMFRVVLIH